MKSRLPYIITLFLAVLTIVLMRVVPHPPNLAAIGSLALFSGAILPRRLALPVTLLSIILSDFFIGFHATIPFTWGSFALIALISRQIFNSGITPSKVIGSSLLASGLFFVISNFGVWLVGGLYAPTLAGFIDCYINALPFFRNTLLSDLLFSSVFFSVYYVATQHLPAGQKAGTD